MRCGRSIGWLWPKGFDCRCRARALLPILPSAAAFLVAVFLNPASETATATTEVAQQKVQVKKASEILAPKAAQLQREAHEKGLSKEAEEQFINLEQGLKQLAKGDDDRGQAMIKMNDLKKELDERREQLRGNDRLKDQLEQLKNLAARAGRQAGERPAQWQPEAGRQGARSPQGSTRRRQARRAGQGRARQATGGNGAKDPRDG